MDNLPPLTEKESQLFGFIRSATSDSKTKTGLALLRTTINEKPVAVIVNISHDSDEYEIVPLAILVNEDLANQLTPP